MPKEAMTGRERWLAVLNREKPDRVPMDYWSTGEAKAKLMRHLGCADEDALLRRLHIDMPFTVSARYVGPPVPKDGSVLGCRYKTIEYEGGTYRECVHSPLAQYNSVEEIERHYEWPSPDWYDYSAIPGQIAGKEDRPIRGGGSEPFLTYKNLRGEVQAFVDLIEHPDIVHYCLDKLFGLAYENTRRIYETIPGKVKISYVAEDFGSQEALLISRSHILEFILPRMKRMMDLAHQAGAFVFFHSDGAVRAIIPDMIEAGIDVLNPVQWRCAGMAREGLKRDFGEKVVFHAGVDNQYTLPFGTVEEVRREVADNLRILGAGGGYILGPCHNIQVVSPPENIVAMYEEGYALGWSD